MAQIRLTKQMRESIEQPTFPVAVVSDVLSNLQQAGWPKGTKKP